MRDLIFSISDFGAHLLCAPTFLESELEVFQSNLALRTLKITLRTWLCKDGLSNRLVRVQTSSHTTACFL